MSAVFPNTDLERFRQATKNQTVFVHSKKYCTAPDCKTVVFDKHKKRFNGMCEKCFKAAK